MKVWKLSGAQLDYWVAQADGVPVHLLSLVAGPVAWPFDDSGPYRPSSDWAQGGPIIERERIMVWPALDRTWRAACMDRESERDTSARRQGLQVDGPTCLIAAMRAYVAGKFGEDIGEKPLDKWRFFDTLQPRNG